MPASKSTFDVDFAVRSHSGLVRIHNEDDFLIAPEHNVFVVADGMGGHAAGMVASGECVRVILDYLSGGKTTQTSLNNQVISDHGSSQEARNFARSLRIANREIFMASNRKRALSGMGTTAVGVRIHRENAIIVNIGDSRCYLLREGTLQQISKDHSLSNFLLEHGRENEARMARLTLSNVIMRALGLENDVEVDVFEEKLEDNDTFMICSDGLSDLVSDKKIKNIMHMPISLETQVDQLIEAALEEGGRDNITVLILQVRKKRARITYDNQTVPISPVISNFEDFGNSDTQQVKTISNENLGIEDTLTDGIEEDEDETNNLS